MQVQQPASLDELIERLHAQHPQASAAWNQLRPPAHRYPMGADMRLVPTKELRLNEQ